MAVFITGATGYIGNNLAMRLANDEKQVHALCRDAAKKHLLLHPNIQIFEGDITDPAAVEKGMTGCTHVYHLAAFARVWAKDPSTFYRLNVEGTKNILDVAKKLQVQKIVFTSTAGVLGPSGAAPVKEDDVRIGDTMNEYEDSKTEAEELCRQYCNKYGMNIVMVNPPRVYGPGIQTESNAVTRLIRLYMQGTWRIMPGDGTKTGSYVYIDDVVNGHVLAMQKGRSGERYILSGVNASYNEFFAMLAETTGKKLKLFNLPVWAMMFAGRLMVLRTKITGKPPLLTPKWIRKYLYDWSLSCVKAQKELGYTYMPLEEGLRKTVSWLKETEAL